MHGNKLRCVKVTHFIRTQTKHYQTSHITFHDGRAYSSVKTILNIHDGVALGEIAITEETSEISTAEDAEEAEEIDETTFSANSLGLRDDDLPPWTYRMGEEGYPPTYLKSRRIRYS
ncbi:hypothetical protein QR680_011889 [Steinernema hermaphroditum]|uniref:PSP proline-rich domain-containing protein n=1 Tax=Steinernema hermaphroditum TaxID=289476 RepID=A0AA39I050_9BILA|nr:hypothetical protein QR680_011889 [Steinernema hermaphroditum]